MWACRVTSASLRCFDSCSVSRALLQGSFSPKSSSFPPKRFCDSTTTDQYFSQATFCVTIPFLHSYSMKNLFEQAFTSLCAPFAKKSLRSAPEEAHFSPIPTLCILNVQFFLLKQNFLDRTLTLYCNAQQDLICCLRVNLKTIHHQREKYIHECMWLVSSFIGITTISVRTQFQCHKDTILSDPAVALIRMCKVVLASSNIPPLSDYTTAYG